MEFGIGREGSRKYFSKTKESENVCRQKENSEEKKKQIL